jgi:2-dehydro-3-deoxy-D-arabinonate dehydratase
MRIAKYQQADGATGVGVIDGVHLAPLSLDAGQYRSLSEILESDDPVATAELLHDGDADRIQVDAAQLLAPIDQQEVWAAGVTYVRSRSARMDESDVAASCYDRVYKAARPELFFKATPRRVSGPGMPVRIRADATWNVPEPELALVLNSRMQLVGFTIGNDMSSRDIEGDNPLYLPQAKVYDQCCGLGPWITLVRSMPPLEEVGIRLEIRRGGKSVFSGATDLGKMARPLENLIEYLSRDNSFPDGAILLTGTGVVPDNDFTLSPGDVVDISIDGIGMLSNPVVQG